ncbi:TonB-dependent siderophore receptor [Sphingomonas sp.]|uniref:TonB-dependent siderophore receptor n=1 Tax=Sphingomonas sp. TaxID=28214 RepID=UPI003B00E63B
MFRLRRARGLILSGAAFCAVQSTALLAQDQTATPTDQGSGESIKTRKDQNGDIVVTAQHFVPEGAQTATKTDIPLVQTPQSISVVTRDQIDLLRFVDAQQAVRYLAGVTGEGYGNDPRFDFVTIRGFTPRQYIDGLVVPATTTIATTGVDIYAFQSLEVLKGPASVLYGAAPPGGILNEVSRRPSSTTAGEARATYGTDDYKEFATTITGPATSFLDVRMTALYRDRELDVRHTDDKRVLLAPSATLKLGPRTSLTGLFYYQYDKDRGGAGGFLPEVGTLLPNPNGRISRSTNLDHPEDLYTRRQYAAGYEFDHGFSDALKFVSNTKWSHYHEFTPIGLYSGGGFVTVNKADPGDPANFRTLQQYNFSYQELVNSFTTDNRLSAKVTTGPLTHKLLVGVDYRNVRNVASDNFLFAGTLDAFDPVYDPAVPASIGYPTRYNQQKLKQTGVYGQDQIGFDNRLFLLLSGRYDWVRARSARTFDFGDPGNLITTPPVYDSQHEHKFTYRAGLSYVTPSGLAPYVGYATSFEPVLGTNATTGGPLKPTTVRQIEGGLKYDGRGLPSDIKIFATLAGFDIRQKNFVSTQVNQNPAGATTQGGEVEVYGAELEVVARIREQLSINAAYSYNHSEVKSALAEPADVGYPLPVTPKHKASALVDYTFRKGLLAGFGGAAGVRYTSRSTGALPGAFGTPVIYGQSATLMDAILHYDLPGWRLAVNASNLLDKRYVSRCAGFFSCDYGAARQVLGTVTKRF